MAGSRKPKSRNIVTTKIPKNVQNPDTRRNLPIVWKFGLMVVHPDRKWNWCQLSDTSLLQDVIKKLASFETMTFHELNATSGNHSISIDKFENKDVHNELEKLGLVHIPELFSLRLQGVQRVYCSFSANEFSLIWLDLSHEVFPCQV